MSDVLKRLTAELVKLRSRVGALERREIPMPDSVGVRVYNSSNVSVSNSSDTVLPFNSELYDTHGMHSTSVNNSRLTCVLPGRYLIIGMIRMIVPSGNWALTIRLNGSTIIGMTVGPPISGGVSQRMQVSTIYELEEDDYVELIVWQNSGSSRNCEAAARYSPDFMMERIGQ